MARFFFAVLVGAALLWAIGAVNAQPGGRMPAFAGSVHPRGVVLQRSRFCFYCHARGYFRQRDARGLLVGT